MSKNGATTKGPNLVIESEADPTIFDDEPLTLDFDDGPKEDVPASEEVVASEDDERSSSDEDAIESASSEASKDGAGKAATGFVHKLGVIFWKYAQGHPHTVLYGITGLVLALLVLIIGFWRTFVIALFVGLGMAVGQIVDGDGVIARLFERFFSSREE